MELAFFFSCTSQGHNALPRSGLELGSSDWEPSALTTVLLDKAVKPCICYIAWKGEHTSLRRWRNFILKLVSNENFRHFSQIDMILRISCARHDSFRGRTPRIKPNWGKQFRTGRTFCRLSWQIQSYFVQKSQSSRKDFDGRGLQMIFSLICRGPSFAEV